MAVLGAFLPGCEDALRSRAERERIAEIRQRVTSDPSRIDALEDTGEPPAHVAVTGHYVLLLKWLLDRGADPAVRDRGGWSTLHHAVFADRPPGFPVMKQLIDRGVKTDSVSNVGDTPLHLAAASSRASAVEFLLRAGAQVDSRSTRGDTPLHAAAAPQPTAAADDARRTIQVLVGHGADVGARTGIGATALHRAALIGRPVTIEALLAEHADVDLPDRSGATAPHG